MKAYLEFRKRMNGIWCAIARKLFYNGPMPGRWEEVRDYDEEVFFNELNSYPWLRDPMRGKWDFTPTDPDLFFYTKPELPWFKERRWARDCGSWADLSYRWAKRRGYKAWVVALYERPLKRGHLTCVFYRDGRYYLADYGIRGDFDSMEAAMDHFRKADWLGNGPYEDPIWTIYHN